MVSVCLDDSLIFVGLSAFGSKLYISISIDVCKLDLFCLSVIDEVDDAVDDKLFDEI